MRIHSLLKLIISISRIKISSQLIFEVPNNFQFLNKSDKSSQTTNFQGPQTYKFPIIQYNSHTYAKKNKHNVIIPESTYEPYHEVIDNPAPGAYRIEFEPGKKYTIPRAKSAAIARENPAIGRYQTIVPDHPGVGRYNISKGIHERGGSAVPKSARTNFISKNTAGVGDYEIQ